MFVVLNDIAFKLKFPNKFIAIGRIKVLIDLVIELKKRDCSFKVNACQRLSEIELSDGYYLSQLFHESPTLFDRNYQTALKTFFLNPNIIEGGRGEIECRGVYSKQCAVAYENKGFLLSLVSDDMFQNEFIECKYCLGERKAVGVTINNLAQKGHMEIHRFLLPIRMYEMNPKHKVNSGWGSVMDLPDDIAQELLNIAIVADTDSKHLIAKYNENYYSFRCHWDVFYHGYRDDDMPQNYKNKLNNLKR